MVGVGNLVASWTSGRALSLQLQTWEEATGGTSRLRGVFCVLFRQCSVKAAGAILAEVLGGNR